MAARRRIVALALAGFVSGGVYLGVHGGQPTLASTARLTFASGGDGAARSRAAEIVEQRVAATGEPDARVTVDGDELVIETVAPLAPTLLREIAVRGDVGLRVIARFVGRSARDPARRCARGTVAQTPGQSPRGCYALAAEVWPVDAIAGAIAERDERVGRSVVRMMIDGDEYSRRAGEVEARQIALVVNGSVLGAPVVTGPTLTIDRNLTDPDAARGLAAVIAVHRALPTALDAPSVPTTTVPPASTTTLAPGAPRADVDHWHAALGVNVCGRWLPPAPEFEHRASDPSVLAGIHSHGEGLVHVHPYADDEAGSRAVLGAFFREGGWALATNEMRTWDGNTYRDGDRCPDGRRARLRWWVDDVERRGDPARWRVRDGEAIVIVFAPPGTRYAEYREFPARQYLPI